MTNRTTKPPEAGAAAGAGPVPSARADGRGSTSLAQVAHGRLRAAIRAHELRPGDRMREADLARWLGISRTPVRDALKQLESEGLLEAAPRRGLVVASLDQQQVSEIYAVRRVLDGLAARLAAEHASPAEIDALRDSLGRQAATTDPARLAVLNEQFHAIVYRAARNRYLVGAFAALETPLVLLPGTVYTLGGRPAEALEQHSQLVDAIEARQPEVAAELARDHLRTPERVRLLRLAEERSPAGS